MKKLILLIICGLHLSLFSQDKQESAEINASLIEQISLTLKSDVNDHLTGVWLVKTGDDFSYGKKVKGFSGWDTIQESGVNNFITSYDFTGNAWIRYEFIVDSSLIGEAMTIRTNLLGPQAYYLNEELISKFGTFKADGEKPWFPSRLDISKNINNTSFVLKNTGPHVLAIRLETYKKANPNFGGFWPKIKKSSEFNTEQNAYTKYLNSDFLSLLACTFFATLGIFHLILFLFYRIFKPNLFFSLLNLSVSFLFLCGIIEINYIHHIWFEISFYFAIIIGLYSLSSLFNSLFAKSVLRKSIIFWLCMIGLGLTVVMFLFEWTWIKYCFLVLLCLVCLDVWILAAKAVKQKQHGAKIIGFGLLFFMIFCIATFSYWIWNQSAMWSVFLLDKYPISLMLLLGLSVISFLCVPLSMSAYLAWHFSVLNRENNRKILELEALAEKQVAQEKEKQKLIAQINEDLESEVKKRNEEIALKKESLNQQNIDLAIEKNKSEALLLNILPQDVAAELKKSGKSDARFFESVTVLVTDFKDFTKFSEKVSSKELVDELNYCYKAFDQILTKYDIEKIKTIGDAYLAVCGLPVHIENHAINVIEAAFEMQAFMASYKLQRTKENRPFFEMRIGIHSGEVIAGIVGVKKFAYDIWGETVNTAFIMENLGEIEKVNISNSTYEMVKNHFKFEQRQAISEEGIWFNMYFVTATQKEMA